MLDYIPYESLPKIEPQNLIASTEKINQSFSEDTVPIPSRIEAINLLRSIHKYQSTFFFELLGALKSKFLKNCLHYYKNPRLQQISLNFIREIYNDDSYEIPEEAIFYIYYDILKFLKSSDNNLRELAKSAIKTMAEKVACNAKIIVLLDTLKDSDENLCAFILECFKNAIENLRGFISLNYNFNDILNKLGLDEINDQQYYSKIKQIFHILKNSLDSNDEAELYQSLEDKYKKIYWDSTP